MNTLWKKIVLIAIFAVGMSFGSGLWGHQKLPITMLPLLLRAQFEVCAAKDPSGELFTLVLEPCYTNVLGMLMKQYGFVTTVKALRSFLDTNKGAVLAGQRCHALAHEVGNRASRMGVAPAVLFSECQHLCTTKNGASGFDGIDLGCMNGAAHTWVLLDRDITAVQYICEKEIGSGQMREGCYHGIGHGLSELYGGDVIHAIEDCKKIRDTGGQYQCAHAIFMEKQSVVTSLGLPTNVLTYCNDLSIQMAASCYEFAGSLEYLREKNTEEAIGICLHVPAQFIDSCMERVGESLFSSNQQVATIDGCFGIFNNQQQVTCMNGFVRSVIDTVSDTLGSRAIESCAYVPQWALSSCYTHVGSIIEIRYGKQQQVATCSTITSITNQQACFAGEP